MHSDWALTVVTEDMAVSNTTHPTVDTVDIPQALTEVMVDMAPQLMEVMGATVESKAAMEVTGGTGNSYIRRV